MRRIYNGANGAPAIKGLLVARRLRERPKIAYPISFGLAAFSRAAILGQTTLRRRAISDALSCRGGSVFHCRPDRGVCHRDAVWCRPVAVFIPQLRWPAVLSYAFDAVLRHDAGLPQSLFRRTARLIEYEKQSGRKHYLVSRELHHRIQNMFQIVQAVVRLSLPGRKLIDSTSVRDRLLNRLEALSATNLMITESEQNGVLLSQIAENEIRPFGERAHLTCDRGLMIGGQMAQNLSLILHELATNAVKHGALSASGGRVVVNFDWDQQSLTLRWHEHDGPPVAKPVEIGFGSRLLNQFARGLGTVKADLTATGYFIA